MDYWQLVRRPPEGGHESVADFTSEEWAVIARDRHNADYQTDEYAVIHRTTEGLAASMSAWWNGKKWSHRLKENS
jgi:hypothetical protein